MGAEGDRDVDTETAHEGCGAPSGADDDRVMSIHSCGATDFDAGRDLTERDDLLGDDVLGEAPGDGTDRGAGEDAHWRLVEALDRDLASPEALAAFVEAAPMAEFDAFFALKP